MPIWQRWKRKPKPADDPVAEAPRIAAPRKTRPEWQVALLSSMEANCIAPSEEAILHAFDLYRDELYAPIMERRLAMANLVADIAADVAGLQALVPDLIERAMARHPFEFSHIINKREQD